MKNYLLVFGLLSMTLVSMSAWAGSYACQGTVAFLSVDGNGSVTVGLSGGLPNGVRICSLSGTAGNNVVADACKGWYTMLLSARASGQLVNIYFNDNLTCTTQPQWAPTYTTAYLVTTAP